MYFAMVPAPRRCGIGLGLLLLTSHCAPLAPESRYGALDPGGGFRFRDAAAVAAFGRDHGEKLCVRAAADGYVWEARLTPALPPEIVPAYLRRYRQRHPDDPRWGLADCPEAVGLPPGELAEYGRLLANERFVPASPARAEALWARLREAGLACLDDDAVVAPVAAERALALALAALEYWHRAGVVVLAAGDCEAPEAP